MTYSSYPQTVDRENSICKNTITVMTSFSLSTNKTGPLHDYLALASNLFKLITLFSS